MKNIFAVASLALMVAACSSTRGKLLSRVVYRDGGKVFEREEYHYSGDELVLSTRVIYFNDAPDSSWTEYEIRRNGQITDTIVTTNSINRTIKSSDGNVRSYNLVGDVWKEKSYSKRDEKGRYIEVHSGDDHNWYTYDALGRTVSYKHEFVNDNNKIQIVGYINEYSDDGLRFVRTPYYQIDTLPKVIGSKNIDIYDNKGRIISRQLGEPVEIDGNHPSFVTDSFQYNRSIVTRIEYSHKYYDGSYHKEPSMMFKSHYRHGLLTKFVVYTFKEGKFRAQTVNKKKYDFRARVPLKTIVYDPREPIFFRKPSQITIWTYDK